MSPETIHSTADALIIELFRRGKHTVEMPGGASRLANIETTELVLALRGRGYSVKEKK